jgi:hypothetical protein
LRCTSWDANLQQHPVQFTDAKRELLTVADKCFIKGWPDRESALKNASESRRLVIELESLRFDYLISSTPLDGTVWRSLKSIFERMYKDWSIDAKSEIYGRVTKELELSKASVDKAALDGPSKAAENDPEFRNAFKAFDAKLAELDKCLGQLEFPGDSQA